MSNKTDLRIIKTKTKLVSAFNDMLESTPFSAISVFDLCKTADIRRATFYKHFSDKYDFMKYFLSILENEIIESIHSLKDVSSPVDYYTSYVSEIVSYLKRRELVIKGIFESDEYSSVMNIILGSTLESLKRDLTQDLNNGELTLPCEVDAVAGFLNGGLAHLIVEWFFERDITEEQFLSEVRKIINKLIC